MNKKYLYALIVLLILLNIYSLHKQVNLNKQLIETGGLNAQSIARKTKVIDGLGRLISYGYTPKLTTNNPEVHNILNEDKVVLYITEGNCGSCIQEALNYMDNLSEVIGKDKLLFMGNFGAEKEFDNYVKGLSGFIGNSVNCIDAGFSEGMNQHPLVFIAKKDLSIQALFVPDFHKEFSEEYYTRILPLYF